MGGLLTEENLARVRKSKVTDVAPRHLPGVASPAQRARGLAPHDRKSMNKLEARYGAYLETLKLAGEVLDYKFQALSLRLADNTFHRPDWYVMVKGGWEEIHETKGTGKGRPHFTEAGWLRFKLGREIWTQYKWRLIYWDENQWKEWNG